MNKKCSRCFIEKPYNTENFPREINKKSGLASHCRDCDRKHRKERIKKLSYLTPEVKRCNHCGLEKPCDSEHFHRHNKNKTGFRSICKECRKPKTQTYCTSEEYQVKHRLKRKNDIIWKLKKNIGSAIARALRNNKECSSFEKLPYTVEQLKQHLERQFEPWMTWENWGTARNYSSENRTWNIDHIIPQSELKYQTLEEVNFLKCWSLDNLRPLDTIENIKKSNKKE